MITNITAHMQVYKNQRAVEECIRRFRTHFPKVKFMLHGDAGINYQYLADEFNLDYIHWEEKNPPIFLTNSWRRYLERLLHTCEKYPNEWFLLVEEDVNTLHGDIKFPINDLYVSKVQPFSFEFSEYIRYYFPE